MTPTGHFDDIATLKDLNHFNSMICCYPNIYCIDNHSLSLSSAFIVFEVILLPFFSPVDVQLPTLVKGNNKIVFSESNMSDLGLGTDSDYPE